MQNFKDLELCIPELQPSMIFVFVSKHGKLLIKIKKQKANLCQDLSLTTMLLQFKDLILFCLWNTYTLSNKDCLKTIVLLEKSSEIYSSVFFSFLVLGSIFYLSLVLLNLKNSCTRIIVFVLNF